MNIVSKNFKSSNYFLSFLYTGGIIEYNHDQNALKKWTLTSYLRATVTANLKEITGETHPILVKTDISKTSIWKSEGNVSKIINMMKSVSNLFKFDVNKQHEDRASLVNIANRAVLPNEMVDKLLAARENGENEINEFVKQKIIENPSKFWEKISNVNTPTFETLNKVMTVPISKDKNKVIKYDKDLFQRFLVVSRSREIDLQDVLSYGLSPVPLSIAHLNGSMRKTAKSNLLKELMIDIKIPDHLPDHDLSSTIYLIDFMVLFQSTQNGESKTFGNLEKLLLSL